MTEHEKDDLAAAVVKVLERIRDNGRVPVAAAVTSLDYDKYVEPAYAAARLRRSA